MKELGKLSTDEEFQKLVDTAVANPGGPESVQVLKTMNHLISTAGGHVDYSSHARAAGITTLHSYTQVLGCPGIFFTLALDDTHNVMAIRMSFPTKESNTEFPAVDGGFAKHLLEGAAEFPVGKVHISELDL